MARLIADAQTETMNHTRIINNMISFDFIPFRIFNLILWIMMLRIKDTLHLYPQMYQEF